jgi:hypothetical protein
LSSTFVVKFTTSFAYQTPSAPPKVVAAGTCSRVGGAPPTVDTYTQPSAVANARPPSGAPCQR